MFFDDARILVLCNAQGGWNAPVLDTLSQGFDDIAFACLPDPTGHADTRIRCKRMSRRFFAHESPDEIASIIDYGGYNLLVSIGYPKLIPEDSLQLVQYGAIGIHPSFLPAYRGIAPTQAALGNGDKMVGVSLFELSGQFDEGRVLEVLQVGVSSDDDANTLLMRCGYELARKLPTLLVSAVEKLLAGKSLVSKAHPSTDRPRPKSFFLIDINTSESEIYEMKRLRWLENGPYFAIDGQTVPINRFFTYPENGLFERFQVGDVVDRSRFGIVIKLNSFLLYLPEPPNFLSGRKIGWNVFESNDRTAIADNNLQLQ